MFMRFKKKTLPERSDWGRSTFHQTDLAQTPIWTLSCKDIYNFQGFYNLERIYCSRYGSGWRWGGRISVCLREGNPRVIFCGCC
jgi:hypothetical protein